MSDLVERLRDLENTRYFYKLEGKDLLFGEAADALEAKDAEIERLREALQRVAGDGLTPPRPKKIALNALDGKPCSIPDIGPDLAFSTGGDVMDDLVERLRTCDPYDTSCADAAREAADEIERLRGLLGEAADAFDAAGVRLLAKHYRQALAAKEE